MINNVRLGQQQQCPECKCYNPSGFNLPEDCLWCNEKTGVAWKKLVINSNQQTSSVDEIHQNITKYADYDIESNKPIFYGDSSKQLWNNINNISDDNLRDTIYLLGCKLQELEHRLEEIETERRTERENK